MILNTPLKTISFILNIAIFIYKNYIVAANETKFICEHNPIEIWEKKK